MLTYVRKHFQNVVLFKKKFSKYQFFVPKNKENKPRYEVQIAIWSFFFFLLTLQDSSQRLCKIYGMFIAV